MGLVESFKGGVREKCWNIFEFSRIWLNLWESEELQAHGLKYNCRVIRRTRTGLEEWEKK